jgi:hypothetical protein
MSSSYLSKPVPEHVREKLLRHVRARGERAVLQDLQMSRTGLHRALAGLDVHAGTRLAIDAYLASPMPLDAA